MRKSLGILGIAGTAVAVSLVLGGSLAFAGSGEGPRAPSALGQKGLVIHLREASRQITLAAGQTDFVASACNTGEAVTGGGPTGIPASTPVTLSTLFFDGTHSGWETDFKNVTSSTVTVTPSVGALCVAGRIVSATGKTP